MWLWWNKVTRAPHSRLKKCFKRTSKQNVLSLPHPQALGREKALPCYCVKQISVQTPAQLYQALWSWKFPNLSEPLISSSVKWDNYPDLKGSHVKCQASSRHPASSSHYCLWCCGRLCWDYTHVVGKKEQWREGGALEASLWTDGSPCWKWKCFLCYRSKESL